jgi:glycosyltransferase involved in cell wall biosynthesis
MTTNPKQPPTEFEREKKIAVPLPCYNEEVTIGKVVADFRKALPTADVYVFDNNSDDDTAGIAADAGAIVVSSPWQGKGNVVRHMFETVEAEIYVMADGDDTYPADVAGELIQVLKETKADMVVGTRLKEYEHRSFRALHEFGNKFISKLISTLFSAPVTDILSGYRVLDRHFVRTLYLQSSGFEVETEMTLQALVKNRVIKEIPIRYRKRPAGSHSKLNTFSDGALVFKGVFLIFKDYKPMVFFSCVGGLCFVLGLIAGWYPIADYVRTQYVSHVPLALLAAVLEVLAVLFLGIGLIMNAIKKFHLESQELIGKLFKRVDSNRDQQ